MQKYTSVNVGLIGCGIVGSGLIKLIRDGISKKYGVNVNLKMIADINEKIKKFPEFEYTQNAEDIIKNPEIEIVVELIGGYIPAFNYIMKSLENKKHIVTANKAVISKYAKKIFYKAKQKNLYVGFEASVCGSIPIINLLLESMPNNIQSIIGIVNGSTNYILTRMREKDYCDALKEAQDKGFAERDPSFDVEGLDSAQKLAILSLVSNCIYIKPNQIYTEGITNITKKDLEYAEELGYTIKLIAVAQFSKTPELRVHPALVSKSHILSSINYEENAIYIMGETIGSQMYTGKGAGMFPTANAVLSDIINIAKGKNYSIPEFKDETKNIKNHNDFKMEYYLKFMAVNKPGVLAKISNILGSYNISILSVIQKERGYYVPIIMMTHKSKEGDVYRALKRIEKLDCIKGKVNLIRVLNN
jgi:homoserine dehydrogenase